MKVSYTVFCVLKLVQMREKYEKVLKEKMAMEQQIRKRERKLDFEGNIF